MGDRNKPADDRYLPGGTGRWVTQRAVLDRDNADWGIMLRSLMVIWAIGATFFLFVLLAGTLPERTRALLRPIDIIAFAVLGLLLAGRERLPRWTPDLCAYLLYLVVGVIICAYGDPNSPFGFFYLWLCVHSFYFLTWRRAAPQVAFIAVNYAAALVAMPGPEFPALRWAITVLTTVVICTLVALLRARVDALIIRLSGVARTDPLTGLRNRRAYDEILAVELARAERTGENVALVVADLDHFKSVNDDFGHPAGDNVLRRVASQLEHSARRIDVIARLGGEEFALILPNTDTEAGFLVAERLRHEIRRAFPKEQLRITMSFGVASYPDDGGDPVSLFAAADAALMVAKGEGRDRTVVCSRRVRPS